MIRIGNFSHPTAFLPFFFSFLSALIAFSVALAANVSPVGLEKLLAGEESLWKTTADDFMIQHRRQGFVWISKTEKKEAKAYRQPVFFLGMAVGDAIARFENEILSELTLYLYNRGDQGEFPKDQFDAAVAHVEKSLSDWTRVTPVELKDEVVTSGMKLLGRAWVKPPHQIKLEWSFSTGKTGRDFRYRSEYIRVRITAFNSAQDPRSQFTSRSPTAGARNIGEVSLSELKSRIEKNAAGDIMITGIPMVYQGDRGYCAVATAERVLRYYGSDFDQHELAQLAMSSASLGTNPDVMIDVLKKTGVRLGCKIRTHLDFNLDDFLKMIQRYNIRARREKLPQIELGREIDLLQVYGAMDPALHRELRLKQESDMKSFLRDVTTYVDQGIPLLWGVLVGIVKETPQPPGFGGHMRLIVGYNPKKSEILYSDTWGPGHESKRMSYDDAWITTMGLYSLEPRKTTR